MQPLMKEIRQQITTSLYINIGPNFWYVRGPLKIHSYIRTMKTPPKILKINFFRTLENNQRLVITWAAFIQEKWCNRGKNSKLYNSFNNFLSPVSFTVALKTKSLSITVASENQEFQQSLKKAEWIWSSLKSPTPENCYVGLSVTSLETPIHWACLFFTQLSLFSENSFSFPHPEHAATGTQSLLAKAARLLGGRHWRMSGQWLSGH